MVLPGMYLHQDHAAAMQPVSYRGSLLFFVFGECHARDIFNMPLMGPLVALLNMYHAASMQ